MCRLPRQHLIFNSVSGDRESGSTNRLLALLSVTLNPAMTLLLNFEDQPHYTVPRQVNELTRLQAEDQSPAASAYLEHDLLIANEATFPLYLEAVERAVVFEGEDVVWDGEEVSLSRDQTPDVHGLGCRRSRARRTDHSRLGCALVSSRVEAVVVIRAQWIAETQSGRFRTWCKRHRFKDSISGGLYIVEGCLFLCCRNMEC